jgi:transcriptional regulator with XRE-family HTH domain
MEKMAENLILKARAPVNSEKETPGRSRHGYFVAKLEQCFLKKIQSNPSYSLRAFAKKLGVDQSFLSKVLKGKKFFSEEAILKIAPQLELTPIEYAQLWAAKGQNTHELNLLEEERFQLLTDWKNFAILELIKTRSFIVSEIATDEFIAARLNVHVEEVRCTLKRLQNLGFIEIKDGKISLLLANNTWTNNHFSSQARRQLQNCLIDKSKVALNEIDYLDRDHGSLTVAIDHKRLPEFKEKLAQIRKELDQYFQASGSYDEVYQLTISFFPLTKLKNCSDRSASASLSDENLTAEFNSKKLRSKK